MLFERFTYLNLSNQTFFLIPFSELHLISFQLILHDKY